MKLNVVTLLMGLAAFAYATHFIVTTHQPWTPFKIAGVAIAAPSFVLFLIARIQLGSNFSVRAKARALVTTGLYSRIRSPIYVFGGLLLVGLALYFRPVFLVGLGVLIPMQIVRARKEEQVLAAAFGEEYRRYKAKTWF